MSYALSLTERNQIADGSSAEQALQQRRADYIAFGRLYIANPDHPERFRRDAPLNQPGPGTFHSGD